MVMRGGRCRARERGGELNLAYRPDVAARGVHAAQPPAPANAAFNNALCRATSCSLNSSWHNRYRNTDLLPMLRALG